jgi:hypothetical protein
MVETRIQKSPMTLSNFSMPWCCYYVKLEKDPTLNFNIVETLDNMIHPSVYILEFSSKHNYYGKC